MDRKTALYLLALLALLLWLFRRQLPDIVREWGGFELEPGGEIIDQVPAIVVPVLAPYKTGPALWTQTTGLMCGCDFQQYVPPILVREIPFDPAPIPRYVYIPQYPTGAA